MKCSTIAPSKRSSISMSGQLQAGATASTDMGNSSGAHSTSAFGQKQTFTV